MWLAGFILLLIALLGAGAYDRFGSSLKAHLSLILAFGGAFLIGIIFNHLIPETYPMGDHVGWIVVLGFLLQGVLEYGSQGIEHGHMHSSHTKGSARMPWAMFFSLCLHALIESMPLHGEDHGHAHHRRAGPQETDDRQVAAQADDAAHGNAAAHVHVVERGDRRAHARERAHRRAAADVRGGEDAHGIRHVATLSFDVRPAAHATTHRALALAC